MAEANTPSILDLQHDDLTPGMKQYQTVKKVHPDCLVMLRMGDFYEMFYEDAVTASRELEITLTSRGKGNKRAPLAGIPFHALEPYLGRIVKKGYKVAIVEQLEDPKKAKGLVKRGLVRIITPGTVIEPSILSETENNYIACITSVENQFPAAFCDLSTGEFFTMTIESLPALLSELIRLNPSECLIPESLKVNNTLIERVKSTGTFLTSLEDYFFRSEKAKEILTQHFNVNSLHSFGIEEKKSNIAVCGALLQYLLNTQKNNLAHLQKVSVRSSTHTMLLDSSTFRNLELTKNLNDGTSRGTLLAVIDKTITSLGSRLLKKWIKTPLLHVNLIQKRLDCVEELKKKIILQQELGELLKRVYDLERLIGRVNYGNASPRDLLSLKNSLEQLPLLKEKLQQCTSELIREIATLDCIENVTALLQSAVREDAPVTIREGNIIKPTFHEELALLQSIKHNSKKYLQDLEEKERQKTGIQNLKIGYTKVFGYYIEITRRNIDRVPDYYIRKQTTVNSERYITDELKKEEEKILGAEEKIVELEYALFQDILKKVASKTIDIQNTSSKIAQLDVLCSLAKVALEQNYCKPIFVNEKVLQIKNGRHPVVELSTSRFITNDLFLQEGEMMIITGPNMAGKSTIMRQTALIVLMAQIGSFVPAQEAVLGIVDRIFTRVGAADDLSSGLSTFMVEMNETAAILNNATEHSLIILDEIGRGTSTFDGVSIAWSVAEHIYHQIKAKTLFATHYHILNKLAEKCSRVKNYNVAVKETREEVIFLHKLVEGGTDESYGIYVGQLAGLPKTVIERAREIQSVLEKDDDMMRKIKVKKIEDQKSLDHFGSY